jgi:hypothetical protein
MTNSFLSRANLAVAAGVSKSAALSYIKSLGVVLKATQPSIAQNAFIRFSLDDREYKTALAHLTDTQGKPVYSYSNEAHGRSNQYYSWVDGQRRVTLSQIAGEWGMVSFGIALSDGSVSKPYTDDEVTD